MAAEFTEYVNKMQEETLSAIKQVQEANLAAFATAREFVASFPTAPFPSQDVPSAKKMIEAGFDFSHRLLDLRKQFALDMTDILVKTQSDAAQTASNAARTATQNIK